MSSAFIKLLKALVFQTRGLPEAAGQQTRPLGAFHNSAYIMRVDIMTAGTHSYSKILISTTILTFLFLDNCLCVRFFLQPHQKRCIKQEMYTNQLATGEYEVSSLAGTVIDMSITDSKGHVALARDNIDGKGKFAVSSDNADFYSLCFTYKVPPGTPIDLVQREIYVDYKVGVEAKSYDTIDQNELSDIETELNRIDDLTNAIIMDFARLKRREREMRDTNESTNTRLFYQSILSVVILLVLATWQILYLRKFFRAKKLID